MKLFKEPKTNTIVEVISAPEEIEEITINGNPAKELKPGESDGAGEKHVPSVTQNGDLLEVVVGEVEHPMMDNHYITNIWAEYPDGTVEKVALTPSDKPEAIFDVADVKGTVKVYEYCNLHGLWVKEVEIDN